MAVKSPFEKGGNRGICFGTPWENPPSPPFTKGGYYLRMGSKFPKPCPSAFEIQDSTFDIRYSPLAGPADRSFDQKRPISNIERPMMNDEVSETASFSLRHSTFDIRYSQLPGPAEPPNGRTAERSCSRRRDVQSNRRTASGGNRRTLFRSSVCSSPWSR